MIWYAADTCEGRVKRETGLKGIVKVTPSKNAEYAFTPREAYLGGVSSTSADFTGWDGRWLVGFWEGSIPTSGFDPAPPLDGAPITVLITRPFGENVGEGFFNYSGYIEVAGRHFDISVAPPDYNRDDDNFIWWQFGEPYQSSGSGHTGYIGVNGSYSHLSHGPLVLRRGMLYPL